MIAGIALLVDGKSVSRHEWLEAIYGNLQEMDRVEHDDEEYEPGQFRGAEKLAELLGWPEDSEKAKHLSIDWDLSYERDSANKPDYGDIDEYTKQNAPCNELTICEIGEIITKLAKVCPKYFVNNFK